VLGWSSIWYECYNACTHTNFFWKNFQLCWVLKIMHLAKPFFLKKENFFAECPIGGTRQRLFKKNHFFAECFIERHSAKNFFLKKNYFLCRVSWWKTLGKATVSGGTAVTVPFLCREPREYSAKPLPSARQMTLGKELFTDANFGEGPLPSAALCKAFAECNSAFAECRRHSAKQLPPVVHAFCTLN
jgi:hypothetical protein